ncbi:MAG: HupE/UreJ family protein [Rubricoccaceae bacterium]
MSKRLALSLFAVLLASLWSPAALAHTPGQSYIFLRVFDASMEARLEITAEDLDKALGTSFWADEQFTLEEARANLDTIRAYAEQHVRFEAGGQDLQLRFTGLDIRDVDFGTYALLKYEFEDLETIPDELMVTYDPVFEVNSDHTNMLVIEHNWKTGTFNNEAIISLIFTANNPRQSLDLSSSTMWNGFWALIKQGVWHIWIGLDHILFLIALVLPSVLVLRNKQWEPAKSFKPAFLKILGVVTSFTVAHSITLTLAALDVVSLPSQLVESIIAGSIIVAALHNLFPRVAVREWMIAFVFGLFHGFGFASVMADIGMLGEFMALSVLGFNLGVELGQLAIIAAVFPVLYLIRTARWYIPVVVRIGSMGLIAVACVWLVERILGIEILSRIRPFIGRYI